MDLWQQSPGTLACVVSESALEGGGGSNGAESATLELQVGDSLNICFCEAFWGGSDERTLGVREGEDRCAELNNLEGGVL